MSRSEILKTAEQSVCIRGINFSSAADIDRQIEDALITIDYWKSQLKMLVVATPKDVTPENGIPMEYVETKANDIMDALEDEYEKLNLLRFARGILNDWTFKKSGMSIEDAFKEAYVDRYADLRQQLSDKS